MFPMSGIVLIIIAFYLFSSIKILSEYERGVIFRLGRVLPAPKGPGIILVFQPLDRMVRVDLRQVAFDVPPQDIITRDNVTLKVNAVVFLRVIDPTRAVIEVTNYQYQTQQFALTTLRSLLGEVELDELLAHRDKINLRLRVRNPDAVQRMADAHVIQITFHTNGRLHLDPPEVFSPFHDEVIAIDVAPRLRHHETKTRRFVQKGCFAKIAALTRSERFVDPSEHRIR